jgi:hypothetical protein
VAVVEPPPSEHLDAPPAAPAHGSGRKKKQWRDRSPRERMWLLVLATVQLTLAGLAWRDLARRDAAGIRGPKWPWAIVICFNTVGPLTYFTVGRVRRTAPSEPA